MRRPHRVGAVGHQPLAGKSGVKVGSDYDGKSPHPALTRAVWHKWQERAVAIAAAAAENQRKPLGCCVTPVTTTIDRCARRGGTCSRTHVAFIGRRPDGRPPLAGENCIKPSSNHHQNGFRSELAASVRGKSVMQRTASTRSQPQAPCQQSVTRAGDGTGLPAAARRAITVCLLDDSEIGAGSGQQPLDGVGQARVVEVRDVACTTLAAQGPHRRTCRWAPAASWKKLLQSGGQSGDKKRRNSPGLGLLEPSSNG